MIAAEFNKYCASLPHATHVVQWGGCDVWKVGGKVFAIGGWNESTTLCVSYKCSAITFEMLKNQLEMRPAPYLASRGMMWLQRTGSQTLDDVALKESISESHRLVSLGLAKNLQKQLGLNQTSGTRRAEHQQPKPRSTSISPRGRL